MSKLKILQIIVLIFFLQLNIINAQDFNLLPDSPTGQIIKHKYFTLSYSEKNKLSEWLCYVLTKSNITKAIKRNDYFRKDSLVLKVSAALEDYRGSGYDRGHLCPAADMNFDSVAMSETFLLTNICPQNPSFNRGIWKNLEDKTRFWLSKEDSLVIVVGPLFIDNKDPIGPNKVTVPGYFYKIIYDCTDEKKMIGFIIPNEKCNSKMLFQYAVNVDYIEEVTGFDFFHEMKDSIENIIESKLEINLWK